MLTPHMKLHYASMRFRLAGTANRLNVEHRTLNVQHRIMYSARREPQGLMAGSNDQFKKKTEQRESTLRNFAVRLF